MSRGNRKYRKNRDRNYGHRESRHVTRRELRQLAHKLRSGETEYVTEDRYERSESSINTRKLFNPTRLIPRNAAQAELMNVIERNTITFAIGPAGTGKTHIAAGIAAEGFKNGDYTKIVLVRPCRGLGMTMGFLPGDQEAKMSPYLRPLFDELGYFIPKAEIKKLMATEDIEIAALEYIRGRTLKHAVVILDEAQNATEQEMQAFLTRLGEGSKYIITGDLSKHDNGNLKQSDLHPQDQGAFEKYANKFASLDNIARFTMHQSDIVRHYLVQKMMECGL